ncbi:MAG: 50S ribosomal protein L29 [Bacteroidaceae bacterium]|nr:50S ribosomal protein L29 [Bacteroidaceae bacterium]MCF0189090.1 50S ribosomal protein L29 [Bacteroidaceae bacterium]
MKTAEIREMAIADLADRLQAAKAEYENTKLAHAMSPLANSASIKAARRDIARMETILNERKN